MKTLLNIPFIIQQLNFSLLPLHYQIPEYMGVHISRIAIAAPQKYAVTKATFTIQSVANHSGLSALPTTR
ncbi:MAG: hypothetical protein KIT59_12040, partial [Nitrosomonas sp.]|nr:hypothetical protein [Nitrosomonas sp.]